MKHLHISTPATGSRAPRFAARGVLGLIAAAITVGLLGLAGPAAADDPDDVLKYDFNPEAFRGVSREPSTGLLGSGLLDASRFSMNHSLSYGYSSSTFGNASGGLWTSSLGYRIADPLHLSVDVGASLASDGEAFLDSRNVFLQGVNLDYRPGDNFHLSISYRNLPAHARAGYAASRGLWTSRSVAPWVDDPFAPDTRDSDRP